MKGMNGKNGNNRKGARNAGTVVFLGAMALVLSGCATMLDQKVVAQGGPEPGWVTNPKAPPGEYVFTGEGTDSFGEKISAIIPPLKQALNRACAQAFHRANGRLDASGNVPVVSSRTWWKRTQGVVGKQYHAYCEIITK